MNAARIREIARSRAYKWTASGGSHLREDLEAHLAADLVERVRNLDRSGYEYGEGYLVGAADLAASAFLRRERTHGRRYLAAGMPPEGEQGPPEAADDSGGTAGWSGGLDRPSEARLDAIREARLVQAVIEAAEATLVGDELTQFRDWIAPDGRISLRYQMTVSQRTSLAKRTRAAIVALAQEFGCLSVDSDDAVRRLISA